MAETESIAWRTEVEARILELETLVESWRQVGCGADGSGKGVPAVVWTVGWHVDRLRGAFEGRPQ